MKHLLLTLCLIPLLASCATIQTNPNAYLQGAGYTAAYLFAQNNTDLIGDVEAAVNRAVTMCDSPTVNVGDLLADAKWFCAELQIKYPKDARLIYPVLYQVELMLPDIDVPANAAKRLPQLKALLQGVQDGLRDARGGK